MSRKPSDVAMWLFSMALTVCLAGCGAATEESAKEVPTYNARTFFETTSVGGASFSHDETRILLSSDASGIFNVYSQPIEGGDPEQLTHSESDASFAVSWFPHDDRFLYTADQGGNELNHLYVHQTEGEPRDLTPGENIKALFVQWSRDGQHFYVSTNERDPQFFDLYRYSAEDYQREMILENTQGWIGTTISPDDRWLALDKVNNNMDSDVYLLDLQSKDQEPRHITPHEENATHSAATFTPDSSQLYYATNAHGEYNQIWSYNLQSGQHQSVIEDEWDVMGVQFSEQGRFRISFVNQDARTAVTILDTSTGQPLKLPELPQGDFAGLSFSDSEEKMAFYLNSDTSPSNLHFFDLTSGDHRQLTDTLNPAIDSAHLVESEVIRYKSFDDLEIPSILYRPHQASASNQVPGLIMVHGGPGGQSRKGYNPIVQHLVNHGYAVLAVNNRGSSGYGKTFFHMDDRKHGEVDLQDCVWGRKYLEGLDWIDGSRIGIIGGSYGGYMVAAALAFEPEAFDVGVDIFGVTNWVRTLKSIPPWWTAMREGLYGELGDPATDEERLRRISPLFHASNIVKPLLVVQGANDPRVLQIESDEIVEAVRNNGVPVEYLVFEDEGHGFRNKSNRIEASDKYVQFLNRYLKGQTSEGSPTE